jgi:IS66 C-terminal element
MPESLSTKGPQTAKLNDVDPQAWLTDVLAHRRVSGSLARGVS